MLANQWKLLPIRRKSGRKEMKRLRSSSIVPKGHYKKVRNILLYILWNAAQHTSLQGFLTEAIGFYETALNMAGEDSKDKSSAAKNLVSLLVCVTSVLLTYCTYNYALIWHCLILGCLLWLFGSSGRSFCIYQSPLCWKINALFCDCHSKRKNSRKGLVG